MELAILGFMLYVSCAFLCHMIYKVKIKMLELVISASPANKKKDAVAELEESQSRQKLSIAWPYVLVLEILKK